MNAILSIAKRYNLKVVEDAAHALPTIYHGNLIGSLYSDATVFSFYATKTITTGEGGMIVTRNHEIAKRCRIMRLHGISRDAFDRYTSKKPSWQYEVIAPGFKYNMSDIVSSLGIHQLKKAGIFQKQRQHMAELYSQELSGLPITLPPQAMAGDLHAWHLYVIRLESGIKISRAKFIEALAENGIGCSVHFIPLHIQPYWKEQYHLKPEDFPVALATYKQVVSLPLYTRMTDADLLKVVSVIRNILK
jgi:dTDP-4-amino-4,6-dideoxygalactose transaminase